MQRALEKLVAAITDEAGAIALEAKNLGDESEGIFLAETIILLRDAQRLLNQAKDALRKATVA